jgi:hypothetical protein
MGFETEEDAIKQDKFRVKWLRRVLPQPGPAGWLSIGHVIWLAQWRTKGLPYPPINAESGTLLRTKLEAGLTSGFPQPTLASSLAMRAIRQSLFGALLRALEAYADADLRTFTIVNAKWTYTPEELDRVTAAQIRNQLRTHLNRVCILSMPGPFICFLHGEFEPTSGLYVLHFHGVTTSAKAAALDRLKNRLGYIPTHTGAAPIRREQVRDRATQFTYLLKSYWPSKAVRDVSDGVMQRDRKGRRIPEPYHTQHLLWLDRQNLADLTLMNGCWSPRNRGPEAMRALYLLMHR